MRLPGETASIMAGQELVVSRWHTRVVNQVTQHRYTSSLGLSSGICLGTISLQWSAISPEKYGGPELEGQFTIGFWRFTIRTSNLNPDFAGLDNPAFCLFNLDL